MKLETNKTYFVTDTPYLAKVNAKSDFSKKFARFRRAGRLIYHFQSDSVLIYGELPNVLKVRVHAVTKKCYLLEYEDRGKSRYVVKKDWHARHTIVEELK